MMCYKDMTFCKFWQKCKHGDGCNRAWTLFQQEGAEKWWGKPGAPVCFFVDKPDCYEFESPLK